MDGVLIIDKPKGYTSHDIVNIVRKELNLKKVGHAGTLDPEATGVLPILVGQATKCSKYLIEHNKEYLVTLRLGIKTDTGDGEGKVISEEPNIPTLTEKEIVQVLDKFLGEQYQIPPIYSAIKINGKKAYEYARKGNQIELTPRKIEIYNIKFVKKLDKDITFKVLCSKGTYIRSLCEDIAKSFKTIRLYERIKKNKGR